MANWFDIGAGAVGGLAGVVSTAMTNQANIQMNRETNQARQALAEWQNQQNLEQWRRENAYNTPSAQMERLRAAGLNPSIMMTQGDVMNEAASSPQMTSAAGSLTTPHIQSPIDALTFSQSRLNNAQAASIEETLPATKRNLELAGYKIEAEINQLNKLTELYSSQIGLMDEERKTEVEKQLNYQFVRSEKFDLEKRIGDKTIDKMDKEIQVLLKDADLKESHIRLNNQDFAFWEQANVYRLLGLRYDNALKRQEIGMNKLRAFILQDEHNLNKLNSKLLGFEVHKGRVDNLYDIYNYDMVSGKYGSSRQTAYWIMHGMNRYLQSIGNVFSVGASGGRLGGLNKSSLSLGFGK